MVNGFMVTRMKILPFIATLSGMLMASGTGLLLAHNQSVSVSYDTDFTWLGQGDLLGLPGSGLDRRPRLCLWHRSFSITPASAARCSPIGGNEEAARLMGLPVDRVIFFSYVQSAVFASLAGVILASQFGAGQPAEGVGWELFSIAAVVVGGTLLTGGVGSVATTLAGVMLLGLIFNVLNFENGQGWISLSAYLAIGGARRLPHGGGDGGRPAPRGANFWRPEPAAGQAVRTERRHCQRFLSEAIAGPKEQPFAGPPAVWGWYPRHRRSSPASPLR